MIPFFCNKKKKNNYVTVMDIPNEESFNTSVADFYIFKNENVKFIEKNGKYWN